MRVLPESPSPNLANIFCNSTEEDPSDMVGNLFNIMTKKNGKHLFYLSMYTQAITLDSDSTPVFQIKAHRLRSGKIETSHYKVTVSRLRARLNIKMSYTTLKGEMAVEGYPDVRYLIFSKYFLLSLKSLNSFTDPHCHEQHWRH